MSEAVKVNGFLWKLSKTAAGNWYGSLHFGGERHQVHRKTKEVAMEDMRAKSERLVMLNRSGGWMLTAEQAAEWHAAKDIAQPYGFSLVDAARAYANTRNVKLSATIPEAAKACLEAKTAEGKSKVYLKDLRTHFHLLCEKFGNIRMTELDPRAFGDWLRKMDTSGRFKNNVRNSIITLWRRAQANKMCPKESEAPMSAPKFKAGDGEITLLSPEQMKRLLNRVKKNPKLLAFTVIGGFCGARSAEILRLDWKDIRDDHIELGADKTKTASRRVVPIPTNAQKWLAIARQKEGRIISQKGQKMLTVAARKAKITWHPNMLRHSFITYRVAEIQNVAQVALEAGNSPQKIFSNYRAVALPDGRLVTKELAGKWFKI